MAVRVPAAISLLLVGGLAGSGATGAGPLLSDSAGATRVPYCNPSQANAVAEVRGTWSKTAGSLKSGPTTHAVAPCVSLQG